ncbi:hypothetical protein V1525DRAFT_451099 [Lipomyces kononenkoae]|uniref:Uncharacterized protein n=1 Tax=Lipomyces kononenkoae TaxID=34357 RepID=A0ACC3SYD3_LIPKO
MENLFKSCNKCLSNHGTHNFDASCPPLRIKATLSSAVLLDNDISVEMCTQTADRELPKRAVGLLRNDIFDCTGYYFQVRRVNERQDGPRFNLSCASAKERKSERDVSNSPPKEFFECCGEIHITFSKTQVLAIIIYEHNGHTESPKFHVTAEICKYIKEQRHLPPRQIYWNLIQLADEARFEKTELHTITGTKNQWERDSANDFRSAQLLIAERDGYHLIEGLQEPGVSLAFTTPSFSHKKYSRGKMTEIFIDSTFSTNKHGYELYCVLVEYDLVSFRYPQRQGRRQERHSLDTLVCCIER